jgi:hypothetical protein
MVGFEETHIVTRVEVDGLQSRLESERATSSVLLADQSQRWIQIMFISPTKRAEEVEVFSRERGEC